MMARFINAQDAANFVLPANYQDFPLSSGQRYGQVATNCRVMSAKSSTNKSIYSRNHHLARAAITEVAVRIPNWYAGRGSSKLEYPTEGTTIFGASIEYPAGTYNRLTFSGRVRGAVMPGGDLVSDFLPISIPDGAEFWTRFWSSTPGAIIYTTQPLGQNSTNGEHGTFATTEVTDATMQASGLTAMATIGQWPLAIIGRTTAKSVALIGDSIAEGVGDALNASDEIGLARAVGLLPYINLGQSGDRLQLANTARAGRLSVLSYVRNAICEHGTNDISNARTLAQIQADMISMWTAASAAMVSGSRVFQTTITPRTTSTDSWATTANQTAATNFSTGGAGTRELLNDWLRDGAPITGGAAAAIGAVGALRAGDSGHPLHAVFEVADVVESARNSGKWKVDGTASKYTSDGVHPRQFGYLAIASSGAVNTASFA